jgi:Rdx family
LRKEVRDAIGVDPKIKWGAPGALDVFVDGRIVFSAKESGRLPTAAEIIRATQ